MIWEKYSSEVERRRWKIYALNTLTLGMFYSHRQCFSRDWHHIYFSGSDHSLEAQCSSRRLLHDDVSRRISSKLFLVIFAVLLKLHRQREREREINRLASCWRFVDPSEALPLTNIAYNTIYFLYSFSQYLADWQARRSFDQLILLDSIWRLDRPEFRQFYFFFALSP